MDIIRQSKGRAEEISTTIFFYVFSVEKEGRTTQEVEDGGDERNKFWSFETADEIAFVIPQLRMRAEEEGLQAIELATRDQERAMRFTADLTESDCKEGAIDQAKKDAEIVLRCVKNELAAVRSDKNKAGEISTTMFFQIMPPGENSRRTTLLAEESGKERNTMWYFESADDIAFMIPHLRMRAEEEGMQAVVITTGDQMRAMRFTADAAVQDSVDTDK